MLPTIAPDPKLRSSSLPYSRKGAQPPTPRIFPAAPPGMPSRTWGRRSSLPLTFDVPVARTAQPAPQLHRASSAGGIIGRHHHSCVQAPPTPPHLRSRASSSQSRPGSSNSQSSISFSAPKAAVPHSTVAVPFTAAVESCSFRARCFAPGIGHHASVLLTSASATGPTSMTQIVCRREGFEFLLVGEAAMQPARRILCFAALAHAELDRARCMLRLRLRPGDATSDLLASFSPDGSVANCALTALHADTLPGRLDTCGKKDGECSPPKAAYSSGLGAPLTPRALHIALLSSEDLAALERHVWPHIKRALLAADSCPTSEPGVVGTRKPGPSLVWTFA